MSTCSLRLLLLTVLSLLAACAGTPAKTSPQQNAAIQRIGVISLAGDILVRKHVGFTVFTNSEAEDDIGSWQLDALLSSRVADAIQSSFGKTTVTPAFDKSAMLHVYDLNGPWDAPIFHSPNWEHVQATLQSTAAINKLDGFVIILRDETDDFIDHTNQSLRGFGTYTHGFTSPQVYACLSVHVLNAAGVPIASTVVRSPGGWIRKPPHADVPKAIANARLSALSPQDEMQLRNSVSSLVSAPMITDAVQSLFNPE